MFDKMKNPYHKFILVFSLLIILVLVLALPALMVRTFGDEVILEADAFRSFSQSDGGVINYTLDVQAVDKEDMSEELQAIIMADPNTFRLDSNQTYYLHLHVNPTTNVVEDTYLSKQKPDDAIPYLKSNDVFIRRDFRDQEQVLLGVDVQLRETSHYLSENAMRSLNWQDYDNRITLTVRIWRGNIQVIEVRS